MKRKEREPVNTFFDLRIHNRCFCTEFYLLWRNNIVYQWTPQLRDRDPWVTVGLFQQIVDRKHLMSSNRQEIYYSGLKKLPNNETVTQSHGWLEQWIISLNVK